MDFLIRKSINHSIQQVRYVGLFLLFFSYSLMAQPFFEVQPTSKAPQGFDRLFTKQVEIFGISIFATTKTPDSKLLHAADLLAQYLDNDNDGQPDNQLVIQAIHQSKGAVVMSATRQEADEIDVHRHIPEKVWGNMTILGLYAEETHPDGAEQGLFDAAYEEILHLITSAGYANAYPSIFGEKRGTAIALAMDQARGGYFRRVPRKYPDQAWYTYDDRSCDYGCQITEYIYWGITPILGAQDFPGRLDHIYQEWRLNTAAKVKVGDPTLYQLLTDLQYAFPTKLPDGKYNPQPDPTEFPSTK